MKNIFYILVLFLILGCKTDTKSSDYEFNETEAYNLVNHYFIKKIIGRGSSIVINSRQLTKPNFEYTSIDEIPEIKANYAPYPIFTKEYWKMNKLINVKKIDWKEYNSYFQKNDSINLEKKWDKNYGFIYVHNVSYPIYNSKTKVAVIRDYEFRPFLICGTELEQIYLFKRTNTGWEPYN